MDSAAAEEKR
uniref:Uncharacterized protein n=1 Tax=Rhizophora mucronata TaxID=61149 RepID=A0A2P2NCJ9_RHIMU